MKQNQKKAGRTAKQKIALLCVIWIAILVLATLLTAFLDPTGRWFRSCLILTICVPILAWVYIWLYGLVTKKHSIASIDLLQTEDPVNGQEDSSDK